MRGRKRFVATLESLEKREAPSIGLVVDNPRIETSIGPTPVDPTFWPAGATTGPSENPPPPPPTPPTG